MKVKKNENLSLQKVINDELLSEQESRKGRKRSGKWSPSSLGGCYRKQYWNRLDEPKTNLPDARTLRVFKVGNFFHEFIQDLIVKQFPEAKIEQKVESDDVLGFADIVLENEVIDVKSMHSYGFKYLDENGYDIEKEKSDHVFQVMTYALLLNKEFVRMVYVSKDDLRIAEFPLVLNDWWKMKIDNEFKVLSGFWESKELPKAEPRLYFNKTKQKHMECNYCNFRDKCNETEVMNGNSRR